MGRKSRAKQGQHKVLAPVPLGQRHTTPGTGRYGLPAWVVVPDDLQLPVRDGQLPGWSPAATVIDFHLPDQLRRAIPQPTSTSGSRCLNNRSERPLPR